MNGDQMNYDSSGQFWSEINSKISDLEERQRTLRERLLLIGKNLIETKEKVNKDVLEIKKEMEKIKENNEKLTSFTEVISGEFSKFARKEDLEILAKQAKMFQPLEFVRKKDLERFNK